MPKGFHAQRELGAKGERRPPWLLVTGDVGNRGAMDQANYALARLLAERQHPVHIVAHSVSDECLALPGIIFHRAPKPLQSVTAGGPVLDLLGRVWGRRIRREGGRVIVNGGNCRFGDINWVHYVHASAQSALGPPAGEAGLLNEVRRSHFRQAERAALRTARLVIANSEKTRRDVTELGVPPQRIRVVYCGIDASRYRPPTAPERAAARVRLGLDATTRAVAFVGVPSRAKGLDTLLQAWKQVERTRPPLDSRLLVFGAGPELAHWRSYTTATQLRSVQMLGFRDDIDQLIPGCDALVAPTRYESYGMGVKEALCAGLPAFVTQSAGIAEHYPAALHSLLLSSPDDPDELARKLMGWLRGDASLDQELHALSTKLRSYTWADMAAKLVSEAES